MRRVWIVTLYIILGRGVVVNPAVCETKVNEVKIEKIGENIKVIIFTDAEEYKDFVVPASERDSTSRIVVDFMNSISHLPSKVSSPYFPLLRIRTSQYKVTPIPITRVVLDLKQKTPYSISATKKGIEINLGKVEATTKVEEAVKDTTEIMDTVKDQAKKSVPPTKEVEVKLPPQKKRALPTKEEPKTKPVGEQEKMVITTGVEKEEFKKGPKPITTKPMTPEPFFYNPRGKRDPFKPYLGGQSTKDTLLDVSTAAIVGIMWSPEEKYALAEDASGKAFILMEGDPVSGGKVLKIEKQEVSFLLKVFGGTKKITLKITPKKEKKE